MTLKWLPLLIAPALLAIACGGGSSPAPSPTPSPAFVLPSPTPEPTPTPTPEPAVETLAFIRDGDVWLINADGSGQQKLFDIETERGDSVSDPRWSPDGSKFAVTGRDDVVYIVAAEGDMLLRVLGDHFLAWSPTGDMFAVARLALLSGERTVFVLDSRGETVIELKGAFGASFSADGERLAFSRDVTLPDEPGGLCGVLRGFVANIRTRQVKPIDPDESLSPGCGIGPAFSPSNPSLITYGDGLIDLESGEEKVLPGTPARWSPDGQLLLLACGRGFGGEVYEVETGATVLRFDLNLLGGDQPCSGWIAARSAWSADSRLLAVKEAPPEPYDEPGVIHIWDIASDEDRAISTNAFFLQFSADSARLVLSDWETIWLLNADGTTLTLLAEGSEPAWQPQP